MEELTLLLQKARAIAEEAHRGQVDKGGKPYVQHPVRVAENCCTPEAKVAALLHDTIEDGGVTAGYLREQGFPDCIVEAVVALTRREGEEYEDYVRRAAANPIAHEVKLADLEDNMDLSRIPHPRQRDLDRMERYRRAWQYLNGVDGKQP